MSEEVIRELINETTYRDTEAGCRLCPRNCGVSRQGGQKGFCGETTAVRIARVSLHAWEEPCISGEHGSGTVFFSGCNLKCIFCQNRKIALGDCGTNVSEDELAEIFLKLQKQGAHNINLVTPTPFIRQIAQALKSAKNKGLSLPVVYNTSAYEHAESLKMLEGLIDIYLPDMKYMDAKKAQDYANAADYPEVAKTAIAEMVRQVPKCVIDCESGLMQKGVVVRHMVLPLGVKNAKDVLQYLFTTYGNRICYSIMNQYTPIGTFEQYPELNRKVTKREYDKVTDYAISLGIENAYVQEGETASESFIPEFGDIDMVKIERT